MKMNILGQTGIEVSELSYGTLTLGKLQADMTPEQGAPAIAKAVESGINFFDTAQLYRTQNHLRIGLGSATNQVVIATKTHAKNREDARKAVEESLTELGREYIDIYHLHLVDSADDLKSRTEALEFLLELKEKGTIRAIGASVHKVEAAKAVATEPNIDILFPIVNSNGLGIPDGSAEDMIEVCRIAKKDGKGIYVMKPLAGGHLRTSAKDAFNFLQQTGIADSICAGMKSVPEVEMNVSIIENRKISQKILDQIETIPRMLKIYDLCIGCGACVDTCDQGALSLDLSRMDESKGKKGQAVVDTTKCILCGYCAEVCPQFTIRII